MILRKPALAILIILVSHAISLLVWAFIPSNVAEVLQASPGRIESLASLLASFSFTMAGFLSAILALFGIMSGSSHLAKYSRRGYLGVLLFVMCFTVVELIATFIFSVRLFFVPATFHAIGWLSWLIASVSILLIFSTVPVVLLVKGTLESVDSLSEP